MPDRPARHRVVIKRFAARLAAFAILWLVLVEGELHHPGLAALTVVGATAVAVRTGLGVGWQLSARGLARFIPYFVHVSLTSAWDVARRTIRGRSALDPALIHYRTRLHDGPAMVFFIDVMCLIPGTLCAGVRGKDITVHVIDRSQDPIEVVASLERRVAALFGQTLRPESGP